MIFQIIQQLIELFQNQINDLLLKTDENSKNNVEIAKYTIKNTSKSKQTEDYYIEKMSKIPLIAKKFFRNVYKQILYEQRILNKEEKTYNNFYQLKLMKDKNKKEFKLAIKDRMEAFHDNYITEKDDELIIEEEKLYINNPLNY